MRKFLVVEPLDEHFDSMVYFNKEEALSMEEFFHGNNVELFSKNSKSLFAVGLWSEKVEFGTVSMQKMARKNLNVQIHDTIEINLQTQIPDGKEIHIAPLEDTIEEFKENIEEILNLYFKDNFLPKKNGEFFIVESHKRKLEFQVLHCEDLESCVVLNETKIHCEQPIKRMIEKSDLEINPPKETWDSIFGLNDIKNELKLLIDPLFNTEKVPVKSILFYGEPGKTLFAKAFAHECNSNFLFYDCFEHFKRVFGEGDANPYDLFELFEKAKGMAPCVLFIKDIDLIIRPQGKNSERILKIIEESEMKCFVVSSTNRPDILLNSSFMKSPYVKKIQIPLPDRKDRFSIFKHFLKNVYVDSSVDLEFSEILNPKLSFKQISLICEKAIEFSKGEPITSKMLQDAIQSIEGGIYNK
jgi:SpoVK/Ycf46/Vps4 family AAA+-type ATPase